MTPLASLTWGGPERGVLIARLPSAKPPWEPIIITTLRRYLRRGVSERLLHRLAGGPRHFVTLNRVWDLDGRALDRALQRALEANAVRDEEVGHLAVNLGTAERRIALLQIVTDNEAAGRMMPTTSRLARYFNCSRGSIDNDLDVLRSQGRITVGLRGTPEGPRRVVHLVGTP